ncbi:HAD-IIIA family hydrolase [bacterium]|nr:HAD-IIIA family hydrolase [bacterium]
MKNKLANIELLLLDVDGVLTDGGIIYSDSGEQIKKFNAKDGLGIKLLMEAGVKVGIISGLSSNALKHRCNKLGITLLFTDIKDKAKALDSILTKTGINAEKMAFVGDDLIDLPVIKRVGVSFCVSDASCDIKKHCDIITDLKGGHGAVREVCEQILKAKGLWEDILNKYLS